MEFELLGNICEVVRGSSPRPQGDKRYYGGNIPRLMIADVTRDKKYVTPIIDSLTEEGAAKSRPMKKGDLIIAVSGDPGRVCFLNVDACIHDGFVGLRNLDESKYDKEFLYYYLTFFKSSMKHRAYGAIFQNITTDILKGIIIPKLSISVQNNIAKLASKAENLIAQRKESIRLLDEFLKSTFLEMFGDPVRNEKGWEKENCDNLFNMKLGKMLSAKNYTGESLYPYLRNVNVKWGAIDLSDVKQMDFSSIEIENYSLKAGDILVCEGGEVGKTAILKYDLKGYCYQNALHRLRIKNETRINAQYFYWLMFIGVKKGMITRHTISVTIAHFTMEKFKKLKIPVPPIELQNQFAQIVEKTETLKTQYQQSLQEFENLYGSLSQKAFRGELTKKDKYEQ